MSETTINTHGMICDFGKHKGERYTRLPVSYLRWMVNTMTDERAAIAQAELDRRGTVLPTIEISGHAIDSASLRIRKQWHESRGKDEGLHAWLVRVGSEALENGQPQGEKIEHAGVRWVFEHGNQYPTLKTVMPGKRDAPCQ